MAFGDVEITVVGNLTADPELHFTPSGAAVANFTVAKNKRKKNNQTQQWEDAGTDFYRVNVWRQLAENVTESLNKGMRVIVQGKLESRDFETRDGDKRTVWEVTATSVGPELSWATARVQRVDRQQGGQNGSQGHPPPADDPWTRTPQGQQQQQPAYQGAPQGQQGYQQQPSYGGGQQGFAGGGFPDEPPF